MENYKIYIGDDDTSEIVHIEKKISKLKQKVYQKTGHDILDVPVKKNETDKKEKQQKEKNLSENSNREIETEDYDPPYFDLLNEDPEILIKSIPIPNFLDKTPIEYENRSIRDLIKSYENQISKFNSEREDYESRLKCLADTAHDFTNSLITIEEKNKEINRLQNALSDAHIYLYEERQKLLYLRDENKELTSINKDLEIRLNSITSEFCPTMQTVRFSKTEIPKITTTHHPSNATTQKKKGKKKGKKSKNNNNHEQCIIRTVYLPTDNVEHLKDKIKYLQIKIQDQDKLLKDRERAFMEDRSIRMREKEQILKDKQKTTILCQEKISSLQTIQYSTMKDYLSLKRTYNVKQSEFQRQIANLTIDKNDAKNLYELALGKLLNFAEEFSGNCTNQVRLYLQQARRHLFGKQSDLEMLHEQMISTRQHLERKLKITSEKYLETRKKLKNLERRRKLEIEGFQVDIGNLRKEVKEIKA